MNRAPQPIDSPRRAASPASIALALLCLVSQLAGFVHLAVAEHTVCPQHGELIEAESAAAQLADPHEPGTEDRSEREFHQTGEPGAESLDQHCEVSALHEQKITIPAAQLVALVAAPGQSPVAAPPVVERGIRALYRTAPKQSPPV